MGDGPNILDETAHRATLPPEGRRDGWIEQRLGYLAGEQARLKGGVPLRRFLRGAVAAYRRFLLTADPAHRFHCWATLQAVSAGLDHLERGEGGHKGSGFAPDGPDPGPSLAAGLTDRPY
jgi:hypothetical protein